MRAGCKLANTGFLAFSRSLENLLGRHNGKNCKELPTVTAESLEFGHGNRWDRDDSIQFLDDESLAERNGQFIIA